MTSCARNSFIFSFDWKSFLIKEVFSRIQRGKRLKKEKHKTGSIPYVSSTSTNNGVDAFIGNDSNVRVFRDCLSLANSGSVGVCFYEPFSFIASDHITSLHGQFTKEENLFLSTMLCRLMEKYNFNREINDNRISREKILLPVNKEGNIPFEKIKEYIYNIERRKINEYKNYAKNKLSFIYYTQDVRCNGYSEFSLLDIFSYKRGNQNNMSSLEKGEFMLVSAKNSNNGIKGFYNSDKEIFSGHCITLNNDGDGGVGLAYYQPSKFLLDSHVYALYPKEPLSKFSLLYISHSISKQRCCFSHGHSISQQRLKKIKILLPVNEKNSPDYKYMEQYIKNIMYKKYQSYLEYNNK